MIFHHPIHPRNWSTAVSSAHPDNSERLSLDQDQFNIRVTTLETLDLQEVVSKLKGALIADFADSPYLEGDRPPQPRVFERRRKELLKLMCEQQERNAKSLAGKFNKALLYMFLFALAAVVVVGIVISLVNAPPGVGGLSGLIPLGVVGYLIRQLKIDDRERLNLELMFVRLKARLITCQDHACLESVVQDIERLIQKLPADSPKPP